MRQIKDPAYYIKRDLPTPSIRSDAPALRSFHREGAACRRLGRNLRRQLLRKEDVIRFDHEKRTYAIYRTADGDLYATDGLCTHSNAHLADGFVSGTLIECAKHNGRFDISDGSPRRLPVCLALKTYKSQEHDGNIFLDLTSVGGSGLARPATTYAFRVVSNDNVATFIKELVVEPEPGSPLLDYQPGHYLQIDIPAYDEISFEEIAVTAPFAQIWKAQGVFDFRASNALPIRRNFSMATESQRGQTTAFQLPNFSFHLVLSEPQPEDNWQSYIGLIHEVLLENYLAEHPDPTLVEYYLCGPPVMIQAALKMLTDLKVDESQIAFDEF